jgi:phytoene synthase
MIGRTDIETSKEIQRETGRTFHLATKVLPEWARYPTYVLYAFFRVADEVVDEPDPGPPAEQRAELERIRAAALGDGDVDDAVLSAFAELRERHDIPDREVHEFVDAMLMDVDHEDYATYDDLQTYLRGSSVAVAYMMLEVMDPAEKEQARPHAEALGEAFQLTNFLRDVREDVVDYDRVYLPLETLREHDASSEQVRALEYDASFADAMRAALADTEARYREGVAGIQYLPESCQLAVLLASTLYAEHHRHIRARECDVLTERRELTRRRRLWVLARTWYHWKRTGDPEATFYAVAPVDEEPTAAEAVGAARRDADGPVGTPDREAAADGGEVDHPYACPVSGGVTSVTGPARSIAGAVRSLLPGSP